MVTKLVKYTAASVLLLLMSSISAKNIIVTNQLDEYVVIKEAYLFGVVSESAPQYIAPHSVEKWFVRTPAMKNYFYEIQFSVAKDLKELFDATPIGLAHVEKLGGSWLSLYSDYSCDQDLSLYDSTKGYPYEDEPLAVIIKKKGV